MTTSHCDGGLVWGAERGLSFTLAFACIMGRFRVEGESTIIINDILFILRIGWRTKYKLIFVP